jgi:hypothetical protein
MQAMEHRKITHGLKVFNNKNIRRKTEQISLYIEILIWE